MSAARHAVEVIEPGLAVAVQDRGRFGHRTIGVPVSGAADPVLLACANRLLGQADDEAALEIPLVGPTLAAVDAPVRLALTGDVTAQLQRADGSVLRVETAHTLTLRRGDRLRVGAVRQGLAYLALAGGCRVDPALGSRATYARAGLGGVQGRALRAGDHIPCGAPPAGAERRAAPFLHAEGPIRVMPGPQAEAFAPEAWATFVGSEWRVARESDRMGLRLDGPRLGHLAPADISSEGVVPGSVQVPANGLPIVLGADAQTVGGYTKIATVIRADLPRLAHARAGSVLRFAPATRAEAFAARDAQREALARWSATIAAYHPPGSLDLERLYSANLVSGCLDAAHGLPPWEPE